MRATKKRKKEEKEIEQKLTEKKNLEEEELKLEKRKVQAAKRKAAREAKKKEGNEQGPTPDASNIDEMGSIANDIDKALSETDVAKKPKTKKKPRSLTQIIKDSESGVGAEPPVWFKKYIAGVKKEEARQGKEKKPRKQVEEESNEVAHKQWYKYLNNFIFI